MFLTSKLNHEDKISLWHVLFGMLLFGVIAVIMIAVWKRAEFNEYLLSVFSLKSIWNDIMYGLLVVAILQIYITIIVKFNRGNFPNTDESKIIFDLVFDSKYSILILGLLPAIFEEIFFRGALLGILVSLFGEIVGVLIVTVLFGWLHAIQYKGQYYFIAYIYILGLCINIFFLWTGTLWGPMIIHFLNNYLNLLWIKTGRIKLG